MLGSSGLSDELATGSFLKMILFSPSNSTQVQSSSFVVLLEREPGDELEEDVLEEELEEASQEELEEASEEELEEDSQKELEEDSQE